jgi:hypothetical protein
MLLLLKPARRFVTIKALKWARLLAPFATLSTWFELEWLGTFFGWVFRQSLSHGRKKGEGKERKSQSQRHVTPSLGQCTDLIQISVSLSLLSSSFHSCPAGLPLYTQSPCPLLHHTLRQTQVGLSLKPCVIS